MPEIVQESSDSQGGSDLRGQHDLPGLLEESRGNKVKTSVQESRRNSFVGSYERDTHRNKLCPRKAQRPGRSTQSPKSDIEHRVDNLSPMPTTSVGSMGQTLDRSLCDEAFSKTSNVRFSRERSSSSGDGRISNFMERSNSLRLPSNISHTAGSSESKSREARSNFGDALLAIGELASRPHVSGKRRTLSSKSQKRPVTSTTVRNSSQQPFLPKPDRLETIKAGLRKKKLSKYAINLALKAKRPSSDVNYGNKWLIWSRYCEKLKIKTLRPKEEEVAEFLVHLYRTKGLKIPTLKNYRSAIASTIRSATGKLTKHIAQYGDFNF